MQVCRSVTTIAGLIQECVVTVYSRSEIGLGRCVTGMCRYIAGVFMCVAGVCIVCLCV